MRKPTNILQELQEEFPDELLNSLPFTQKDIDNIIQQGMHLEDILKENPEEEE